MTKARLKPAQRVYILRTHLIPRYQHCHTLGKTTKKSLKYLDVLIRGAVRSWLRLPKDTSLGVFYASCRIGGLGLQSFEHHMFCKKIQRLNKLSLSDDPVLTACLSLTSLTNKLKPVSIAGVIRRTPDEVTGAYNARLMDSCDGEGLIGADRYPFCNRWITSGTSIMKGYQYVDAFKLKHNLHFCKSRGSRMYSENSPYCDAFGCHGIETVGHILQSCPQTHGIRVKRHDRVLDLLASELSKRWEVKVETQFRTGDTSCIPDLVIALDDSCLIIDVRITPDNADLDDVHRRKVARYNTPQVRKEAEKLTGKERSVVSACVLNWRGTPASLTVKCLLELGLKKNFIEVLSIRTLEGGCSILRIARKAS